MSKATLLAAAAGLAVLGLTQTAFAQSAPSPQGDSWDSIKLLPDWSGIWTSQVNPGQKGMIFNAKGKAAADKLEALRKVNGDIPSRQKLCLLSGFPGGMGGPEQFTNEFLFTPGQVTLSNSQAFVRRIFTDGRKHHKGPPTLQGDSIGHWEGQTLVVDTIGMHPDNEAFYGFRGGKDMHVVERFSLKDDKTLQVLNALDAPEVLAAPDNYRLELTRHRDWTTVEMNCAQGQRSIDKNGNQTMILDK